MKESSGPRPAVSTDAHSLGNQLSKHGVRPTIARVDVLRALVMSAGAATDAELYAWLQRRGEQTKFEAVVRNLRILERHGLAVREHKPSGKSCFRVAPGTGL